MRTALNITVIGAGAGGLALASSAVQSGANVTLLDHNSARLAPIQRRGTIEVAGLQLEQAPVVATTDAATALSGAELVVLAVLPRDIPSTLAGLAGLLPEGSYVLAAQSHFGAALASRTALGHLGVERDVTVGESASYPFVCTSGVPGSVRVIATKRNVPVAALPGARTAELARRAAAVASVFTPAESVLHTSLGDVSASIHVPTMVANAGRIEHGDVFDFFLGGLTKSVERLAHAYDSERCILAAALGITVPTVAEWVHEAYGRYCAAGSGLGPTLHTVFGTLDAPSTIAHRYLVEDLSCITVPTLAVANIMSLDLPIHRAIVDIASSLCGENFQRTGRTAATLGIAGATPEALQSLYPRSHPE